MKVLWKKGPMALGEIYDGIPPKKDWAYSTVKTLVRRLMGKGWIKGREVGGSFLYSAAVSRDKAVRSALKEFTDRVLDGLFSPFFVYMAEDGDLSQDDLDQAEKIIRELRKKNKGE
jgi:predicted transcriptional regulator